MQKIVKYFDWFFDKIMLMIENIIIPFCIMKAGNVNPIPTTTKTATLIAGEGALLLEDTSTVRTTTVCV
jgi:hypothetical protein